MRATILALGLTLLPMAAAVADGGADGFYTLKGHGGPIMGIAVAPDGRVASASFDNSIGLWTDAAPVWLDGHEAAVVAVRFADRRLYSAGDDFTIRRWPEGEIIGQHRGKVAGLAIAGGTVASASWDGTIGIWPPDGPAQTLRGHDQGVNAVAFAPNGTALYSASTDGTLRIWDLSTGHDRVLVRHGFGINKIILNAQAGWIAYGAVDGVTRIIDAQTGQELRDFTLDRRPVLALALSPDGQTLAVGDGDGYIMVIDTGAWRITHDTRATLRGPVWALAFSPDGQSILAGGIDDAVYSWPLSELDEHGQMAEGERSFLKDPALMENGERQFARKCSICHTLTAGFGRRAGSVADYTYSETLTGSDIIWTEKSVGDLFDLGPDHYIPGSKMPMQRITDPQDRADLVAYLRRATGEEKTE